MQAEVPAVASRHGEIDETYVGNPWRNWQRLRNALGSKHGHGTSKTPVFRIPSQGGQVRAQMVTDLPKRTLLPVIRRQVRRGPIACTYALRLYSGIASTG